MAVLLEDTTFSWTSSTQKYATNAMCKAEHVAMFGGSKEGLFMRAVLVFLQPELNGMRGDVFGHNEEAKSIADNPIQVARLRVSASA